MTNGFREFEFDLPDALLVSLVNIFSTMVGDTLDIGNVATIPDAQGVYQLLLRGQVVYIGKTDADAGLRKRLERHARNIQHRQNLSAADVTFKAVRVFVFTAMDLETQLIRHYGTIAPVPWNNSGFGSNDPGRQRDETVLRPDGFDALYPINLAHEVNIQIGTVSTAASILNALRAALPYTLRVEREGNRLHSELEVATISLDGVPKTTIGILLKILSVLPGGWQATALAGRIILYKENKEYRSGFLIGRSSGAAQ